MKAMVLPDGKLISRKTDDQLENLYRSVKNWKNALLVSASFGAITGLLGIILNGGALVGFFGQAPAVFSAGVWLIVITFPCLAFAAHCLDKIDEKKKSFRIERCKKLA